jgi:hypothetical protein
MIMARVPPVRRLTYRPDDVREALTIAGYIYHSPIKFMSFGSCHFVPAPAYMLVFTIRRLAHHQQDCIGMGADRRSPAP